MKHGISDRVRLFVSYAHQNAAWFARLRPVLEFPYEADMVGVWHDQELKAGDRWDDLIRQELERMDVFVCMLSFEFLASYYIREIELSTALHRARARKHPIEIVPVVIYPMDLRQDCKELHPFNPLPEWGKCWRDYEHDGGHYQDAHKPIRRGLRQAIQKVQNRRQLRNVGLGPPGGPALTVP